MAIEIEETGDRDSIVVMGGESFSWPSSLKPCAGKAMNSALGGPR
jgi:hypothetical protein